MGLSDAAHEETDPDAPNLVISRLACSLVGQTQPVTLVPGTLARQTYGRETALEQFRCHYGLAPTYRDRLDRGGLRITGLDAQGEARIAELPGHRFFLATLFLPQLSSRPGQPHPLIVAFLRAALAFRLERDAGRA